ncbi:hypothetical protein Tsubulata_024346 [Turnera subulata]|uniref:Water stress and hypersensitive response domain-containing protein n=1 Tax=Turnera subulata TaxID=218843 RepID=A0A9Q0JJF1_9ROSI|nr:hypothetical protein Tsubulata_024346 [Turnera subulata]
MSGLTWVLSKKETSDVAGLLHKATNIWGSVKIPNASITGFDITLHRDTLEYKVKISVTNPYTAPLPTGDLPYVVKSAGRVVASGTIPDPGYLKAKDTTVLDVPLKVPYGDMVSLVKDITAIWDIDYEVELGLGIVLPVVGKIIIPLKRNGEIKFPTIRSLF